jgi:hypothetical protein
LIVMLDVERDSMVDTIAAVRFDERVANAHHHPPAGLFAVDINIEPGRVNDDVRQSSQNIQQATFLCPETISKSAGLDKSLGPC